MTTKHYPDIEANPNFPALEEDILRFWEQNRTFAESVVQRPATKDGASNAYVFYDGPLFANGLPHYGHLLTGYVKDAIARYHTMKGKRVERRFGWDCHGLPAEMGAEKELGISGRAAIAQYGIGKFNEHCRTSVMKYTKDWEYYVSRQGRWVDFKNDYKTMDKDFMESVLWAFKQLYEKSLIYESLRVMPYSWAAETPVSNFETRIDNATRPREDKAAYVKFKLKDVPAPLARAGIDGNCYLVAWTTTPWTLPSNLALAVGNLNYVGGWFMNKESQAEIYICADFSSEVIFKELEKQGYHKMLGQPMPYSDAKSTCDETHHTTSLCKKDLEGIRYAPLFPYFKDTPNAFRKDTPNAFRVLDGSEFVTEGDGTGIVHMAPGFGEADQQCCLENGIEELVPVDEKGKFTAEIYDLPDLKLQGLVVVPDTRIPADQIVVSEEDKAQHISEKDVAKYGLANMRIVRWLKAHGLLVKDEPYTHNYPHCWRTDTPLIYRAMSSWYVQVQAIKDKMAANNQTIHWIPDHVKDGQMGKGIESAPDWSISRNRFWGTPIPIWKSASGKIHVCGSIEEIEKLSGKKVADLHRPYIDEVVLKIDGEEYHRIEDVFDCWFESGSMPFAQLHYPFENKERFEESFPADFITEYIAQTRGWFYTLQVLSAALFGKAPFKNVICHGVVIDEETGLKYSKRLKNYKDPKEVMDAYGADALRWMMLSSPVMRGADLAVDPDGKFIRDVVRLNIKPLWSAFNFFTLYANADGVKAANLLPARDETERCLLRPFTAADEADYSALVGNAETMKTIGGGVRSAEEAKKELAFLIAHQAQHGFSIWAVCDKATGKLLGKAGYTYVALDANQSPQASLHYLFGPESWGKGIAKEVARHLVQVAFMRLGLEKIVAATLPDNVASVRIVDANRFVRKGDVTFREKVCAYYELTREEFLSSANLLDRYILAKAKAAVTQVQASLGAYDTPGATEAITQFFDVLNNWYIRRSRPRFWGEEMTGDKQAAYDTLFTILNLMCLASAPLLPFVAESVYRGLNGDATSVHLQDFPDVSQLPNGQEDEIIEMDIVRDICTTAHAIRNKANIRTRQPLGEVSVYGDIAVHVTLSNKPELTAILLDEVNAKKIGIGFSNAIGLYATQRLQINFPVLGKRLPEKIKQIIPASKKGEWKLLENGHIEICNEVLHPDEGKLVLEPKPEYKDRALPLPYHNALVILDLTITPELEAEGRARDLVRMIQQARKDAGLHVADRITLALDVPDDFKEALVTHGDYIAAQTLATSLKQGSAGATQQMKQELDGEQFVIGISRAA